MWKKQLQEFANVSGLEVSVSHFPPGTSKWNKVEHRLFCFINKNRCGKSLVSVETVINLISNTATSEGLRVACMRDEAVYELGAKATDEEMSDLSLTRDCFHGDWNYTIYPK